MKNHSSTIEAWTLGVWGFPEASSLDFGAFAHSCFPAFLILISTCFPTPRSRLKKHEND
jgi:hypothetical protein